MIKAEKLPRDWNCLMLPPGALGDALQGPQVLFPTVSHTLSPQCSEISLNLVQSGIKGVRESLACLRNEPEILGAS